MSEQAIANKFDHLFQVIQTEDFLQQKALGGEIPFFIFAYKAQFQNIIDTSTKGLINKLEKEGVSVLELNLYDIGMEILQEELGENEIFELEQEMDKEEFKAAIQSVLDLQEVFMPRIKQKIDSADAKVYFLTGIGMVFPYIRSHSILNNLQNIAKEAPTLTFFPGNYTGQTLELFGKLKDDNYYRAFNIDNYKL